MLNNHGFIYKCKIIKYVHLLGKYDILNLIHLIYCNIKKYLIHLFRQYMKYLMHLFRQYMKYNVTHHIRTVMYREDITRQ